MVNIFIFDFLYVFRHENRNKQDEPDEMDVPEFR